MAKPKPWYQNLQVVAWAVGGLAALGTATVVAARYITLPDRVEASEHRNELQDNAILELKKTNEVWQQIYQQQQQAPNQAAPRIQRIWDTEEQRYYCDDGQQQWWANREERCE